MFSFVNTYSTQTIVCSIRVSGRVDRRLYFRGSSDYLFYGWTWFWKNTDLLWFKFIPRECQNATNRSRSIQYIQLRNIGIIEAWFAQHLETVLHLAYVIPHMRDGAKINGYKLRSIIYGLRSIVYRLNRYYIDLDRYYIDLDRYCIGLYRYCIGLIDTILTCIGIISTRIDIVSTWIANINADRYYIDSNR